MLIPRVSLVILLAELVMLASLLLPLGSGSVYDGHFEFVVRVEEPNLACCADRVAICWQERDAELALVAREDVGTFRGIEVRSDGSFAVETPFSGRIDGYGRQISHHEPICVVLEWACADGGTIRQRVDIPPGRGDRTNRPAP